MGEVKERASGGFLIKQRAFIKLYIITYLRQGSRYGNQIYNDIKEEFKKLHFIPQQSEIYRALHELLEDDVLSRRDEPVNNSKYKEVTVYKIKDMDHANAYKKLVKADLDRSAHIIEKALKDNF